MKTPQLPDAHEMGERSNKPQHVNRCSSIGHPCPYHGYLSRTRHEERRPWGDDFQRIFRLGNLHQDRLFAALSQKGLRVIRSEETLEWPEYQLFGHMDGCVPMVQIVDHMVSLPEFAGADLSELRNDRLAAIDAKSMDPNLFADIRAFEDLLAPLTGAGAYRAFLVPQLTLYARHPRVSAAWCCIYAVNRANDQTRQIWWRSDDPRAVKLVERALASCALINDAIASETPAAEVAGAIAVPGSYCQGCAFSHTCERYTLTGNWIRSQPELEDLIDLRQDQAREKKPAEKCYKDCNERLRTIWKVQHEKHGDHEVVCGRYAVKLLEDKRGTIRATYKEI